jgi:hypothetical protein
MTGHGFELKTWKEEITKLLKEIYYPSIPVTISRKIKKYRRHKGLCYGQNLYQNSIRN